MSAGVSDSHARRAALDPGRSFIVQAPAGSGKTELLIQRYLVLLATVDEPEQVVAITFTRKAAAEMRARVQRALQAAANGEQAAEPHRATTLSLARAAVARSAARSWSLPSDPRRIRIETLDALNARLARQLPALSGGVAGANIAEDALTHYRLAATRTVAELERDDALGRSVRLLLRMLDNSLGRLETMLAELLPKREQWLPMLAGEGEPELRLQLERSLERLVDDELASAVQSLPQELHAILARLLTHAAHHAASEESRECFAPWADADDGTRLPLDSLRAWRALAHLLLTKGDDWRRKLDRSIGFGPSHPVQRERLQRVLAAVSGDETLRERLAAARRLPDPRYSDEQWDSVAALSTVLLRLVAELRVVFAEQQVVDFVELAMAAQHALGRAEAPSELLLALDRRIQHILVDEFQDTSHSQFRLLELLTAGWEQDDGRTLFLVGDPMQSIYRFRNADMSLFLRVRRDGIGAVRCEPLMLNGNFRSARTVVDWVNDTFRRVFPPADDIVAGAARFAPSVAARPEAEGAAVRLHALCADGDEELGEVIAIIERERREIPTQSIAVLVQSRTHLAGLHERLLAAGLDVHAVDVDPLNVHQVVQDLIGLTRALTHAADRIAWLGVLRAPWCGMGWCDLEALCGAEPQLTIPELLHDPSAMQRVGLVATQRLARLRAVLTDAFSRRAELPFPEWVEYTWASLGGPACLASDDERLYAQQFFDTLEALTHRGDVEDPAALEPSFAARLAQSAPRGDAAIEIMTIHRAKGLEFDTVILFGLGREPRRDEQQALYWMERVAGDGSDDLIVAPLTAPGSDDRLTRLVRGAEDARERAERARLLYVAATRARNRLHLVCRVEPGADSPPSRSLMTYLWPQVHAELAAAERAAADPAEPALEPVQPVLRRLRADAVAAWDAGTGLSERIPLDHGGVFAPGDAGAFAPNDGPFESEPAFRATGADAGRPEFDWASTPAMHVGTLVHRHLQRIAADGLDAWHGQRVRAAASSFCRQLLALGLDPADARAGAERVQHALEAVLHDPQGRWILGAHAEAASEVTLIARAGAGLEHIRLDRTFVDSSGTRWIIDFKTGSHEGGDLEAFLESEVDRYRPQLHRYAAAMAAVDARPIEVGLYFPLLAAFRYWRPFG